MVAGSVCKDYIDSNMCAQYLETTYTSTGAMAPPVAAPLNCHYDQVKPSCPGIVMCASHCSTNGGIDNNGNVCCTAMIADCMACQSGMSKAAYCASRPTTDTTPGCPDETTGSGDGSGDGSGSGSGDGSGSGGAALCTSSVCPTGWVISSTLLFTACPSTGCTKEVCCVADSFTAAHVCDATKATCDTTMGSTFDTSKDGATVPTGMSVSAFCCSVPIAPTYPPTSPGASYCTASICPPGSVANLGSDGTTLMCPADGCTPSHCCNSDKMCKNAQICHWDAGLVADPQKADHVCTAYSNTAGTTSTTGSSVCTQDQVRRFALHCALCRQTSRDATCFVPPSPLAAAYLFPRALRAPPLSPPYRLFSSPLRLLPVLQTPPLQLEGLRGRLSRLLPRAALPRRRVHCSSLLRRCSDRATVDRTTVDDAAKRVQLHHHPVRLRQRHADKGANGDAGGDVRQSTQHHSVWHKHDLRPSEGPARVLQFYLHPKRVLHSTDHVR